MRKIRKCEIRKAAQIMAENFADYPIYSVFFKDDGKKIKRIFYFFWYRIYTRRSFTYITSEDDLVVSFKKPEDRLDLSVGLWMNPIFFFGFLMNIPMSALALVLEFGRMEKQLQDQFYNPLTDCYAQAICVLKKSRGNGRIFQVLKELDDGRPIFCETHTKENARLYEHMGLEVCGTADWHGVTHFAMKKSGSYIRIKGPLENIDRSKE